MAYRNTFHHAVIEELGHTFAHYLLTLFCHILSNSVTSGISVNSVIHIDLHNEITIAVATTEADEAIASSV